MCVAGALSAVLVTACSSGLTMSEYAGEIEQMVQVVDDRIDSLDLTLEGEPTLTDIQAYWSERMEARAEFLDGMSVLEPPDEAVDVHQIALEMIAAVVSQEQAMADYVAAATDAAEAAAVWDSPAGLAAREADGELVAFCAAVQESFDATAARDELADVPWIPPEMREVIRVTFGCGD
jgi:hypothetical protein